MTANSPIEIGIGHSLVCALEQLDGICLTFAVRVVGRRGYWERKKKHGEEWDEPIEDRTEEGRKELFNACGGSPSLRVIIP